MSRRHISMQIDALVAERGSVTRSTCDHQAHPVLVDTLNNAAAAGHRPALRRWILIILCALAVTPVRAATNFYEWREPSRDGIGKFYMGREIAHVMGHQAADWLERAERDKEEHTERMIDALGLREGDVVADIGAGTGYFTRRMAKRVGGNGKVYAVDIQPEMLALLTNSLAELQITNVVPVFGTITNPNLPMASIDLALLVDVYHEFSHPHEMIGHTVRALKPKGRLVFVEFRGEDPKVPIKPLHKMTEAQVRKEMSMHALKWTATLTNLPRQHIIIFQPRGS